MTSQIGLITRSPGGSAVAIAAQRMGVSLEDRRTRDVHDHRLHRDARRNLVATHVPPGAPTWSMDTAELWTKVEWAERLGGAPVLCELRLVLPDGTPGATAHAVGAAIAKFMAAELYTAVSFAVIDGMAPWPVRDDTGSHVRLCFPTRSLASSSLKGSIVDRSGGPSGFASRHVFVANPHVKRQFEQHVADAFQRIIIEHSAVAVDAPYPPGRMRVPVAALPEPPTMTALQDSVRRVLGVPPATATVTATTGLIARLKMEGPVLMTEAEQQDFDWSLNMASNIEQALGRVTAQASSHQTLVDAERRVRSHTLDHEHQLDVCRAKRDRARLELEQLKASGTPRFLFVGQRMQLAVFARGEKARELDQHHVHVGELKIAVASLKEQTTGLVLAVREALGELNHRRGVLRDAVRRLHGHEPGMLQHLLGLLTGHQRTHLKDAMNEVVPAAQVAVRPADAGTDEGGGGLRAKMPKPGPR